MRELVSMGTLKAHRRNNESMISSVEMFSYKCKQDGKSKDDLRKMVANDIDLL